VAIHINSTEQLIAAVPHLLGYAPQDSLVVVSVPGGFSVRVDHPTSPEQLLDVAAQIGAAYQRNRVDQVAICCYTAHLEHALDATTALTGILDDVTTVAAALHITGDHYLNLGTGTLGHVSESTRDLIAAQFVAAGHAQPLASRESAARTLLGDPAELDAAVPDALQHTLAGAARHGTTWPRIQARWLDHRISRFLTDQRPFSVHDAARTLLAVDQTPLRDVAWRRITHADAPTHVALWRDLTRRAPDDLRTPAAALLAFAAWLSGDGSYAWIALDRIPVDELQQYTLAVLVGHALTQAVPPSSWTPIADPHPLLT
jgi:hypothetical protein